MYMGPPELSSGDQYWKDFDVHNDGDSSPPLPPKACSALVQNHGKQFSHVILRCPSFEFGDFRGLHLKMPAGMSDPIPPGPLK